MGPPGRSRIALVGLVLAGLAAAVAPPTEVAAAQSTAYDSTLVAGHNTYNRAKLDSVAAAIARYCRTFRPSSYICTPVPRQVRDVLASDVKLGTLVRPNPTPPPPPGPAVARVDIHANGTTVSVGQTLQLYAEPKDAAGTVLTTPVAWGVAPTALADISGSGLLTGKGDGTVTVTARADTVAGTRVFTVIGLPPPPGPDTTVVTPPVVVDSTALPPVPGRATLAELPRATVDITLPTGYTVVNVPAQAGALQQALDAAGCRTELRGAPGFAYGPLALRVKPCNERYHTVIRTANNISLLAGGVRITPGLSAQRQQTQIVSADAGNTPAVSADAGVRGYYFEDVAILGRGTADLNALVKLGINQTTLAQVPGDFVFRHVYASGTPTLRLKRNFYINSSSTALVDSWCAEGHDNNGDSQCWLGLNGPGPYLIENNYMEASHEVIMFGGGDPSIPGLVPSDVTIRRNHVTRPLAWKGVWGVKNLIECKNARRMLIEGNVMENNWADGQVGYAFLCKSVNQDGTAPQSQATDITFRYNLVQNTGAGLNLCAACQGTVVPATRLTLYDNLVRNINVAPFNGEGRELQLLGALTHLSITHNTWLNAQGVETAISFDGQPPKITNFDFRANAWNVGLYNIHGGSGGNDWPIFADTASTVWRDNLGYTSDATSGFDAKGTYTGALRPADARPLGANAALVFAKTAGVVVRDPLRPGLRPVTTAARSGYRRGCLRPIQDKDTPACIAARRETFGAGTRVQ